MTELSDETSIVIACERMGWTYQEFMSQPQWLIKGLFALWNSQAEAGKAK